MNDETRHARSPYSAFAIESLAKFQNKRHTLIRVRLHRLGCPPCAIFRSSGDLIEVALPWEASRFWYYDRSKFSNLSSGLSFLWLLSIQDTYQTLAPQIDSIGNGASSPAAL